MRYRYGERIGKSWRTIRSGERHINKSAFSKHMELLKNQIHKAHK